MDYKKNYQEDMRLIDYLDPKDLRSPLPPHNTIELINKLTPTQLCMAIHVLIHDVDQYYLHRNTSNIQNIKEFLQGANELPAQEDYLGILYQNHQVLRILICTWINNPSLLFLIYDLKKFDANDSDEIPYEDLITPFKNLMTQIIGLLDKCDKKIYVYIEKAIYKYFYGINQITKYNIIHLNDEELINHPYFKDRYFNQNILLLNIPGFHDDLILINYCVIYKTYNILNVKKFLDYFYQCYLQRDTTIDQNFHSFNFIDRFLNNILGIDFIKSLEKAIFAKIPTGRMSYTSFMRAYLFYLLENNNTSEKVIEILKYLNEYFSDTSTIEPIEDDETLDKIKINTSSIVRFLIAQRVRYFHEIIQYMLLKDDEYIPLSWQIEEYISNNPLIYKNLSEITNQELNEISLL